MGERSQSLHRGGVGGMEVMNEASLLTEECFPSHRGTNASVSAATLLQVQSDQVVVCDHPAETGGHTLYSSDQKKRLLGQRQPGMRRAPVDPRKYCQVGLSIVDGICRLNIYIYVQYMYLYKHVQMISVTAN